MTYGLLHHNPYFQGVRVAVTQVEFTFLKLTMETPEP